MSENDEVYVFLARLEPSRGYLNFGNALELVGELQQRGIWARAEPTPGAPLEGVTVYNLMVRADQYAAAKELLKELDSRLLK